MMNHGNTSIFLANDKIISNKGMKIRGYNLSRGKNVLDERKFRKFIEADGKLHWRMRENQKGINSSLVSNTMQFFYKH